MKIQVEKDESHDLFRGFGIEININNVDDGGFLKIRETLTRMGISDPATKTLYQSCHILHKRRRYVIIHYKELRCFDGKEIVITEDDIARRNTIVSLLEKWNLLEVLEKEKYLEPRLHDGVAVIPFGDKKNWNLVHKYVVGGKAINIDG